MWAICISPWQARAEHQTLHVLHWWKSPSERQAVAALMAPLRRAGYGWEDIEGGNGLGANIMLRSRILSRNLPDAVQVNNFAANNWAVVGDIIPLDDAARTGNWNALLLPAVARVIEQDGHVLAVPLGVHRLNTLIYNRRVFDRLRLTPPRTWDQFESMAPRLERAGVVPLSQSSEPWQIAVLFENLVLADLGVAFHRQIFLDLDESAFTDPLLGRVLQRLRRLKRWMRHQTGEDDWVNVARQLGDGHAAMLVGGDWVKAELNAAGLATDVAFGCAAAPGTANVHLYDLDALAMLRSRHVPVEAQRRLAAIAMSTDVQDRYNRAKGSVPVIRRPGLGTMDSCARESWTLLARPGAVLVPGIVVGMSGDESMRNALVSELHRFFSDDRIDVLDTQQRLAIAGRAIKRTRQP